ncbi:MAG: DUF86 domain-containing protein [Acidobacteriota bacterium]|nr:DUF86 domain-containing protein [Acidobacteriota bacterium]
MLRDDATVLDLLRAARLILDFTRGIFADAKTQSAVLHQMMIVGEAVKRLSPEFRDTHSQVPWPLIAGMRDKLIHKYDEVDLVLIWQTVQTDIPSLLSYLEPLALTPKVILKTNE